MSLWQFGVHAGLYKDTPNERAEFDRAKLFAARDELAQFWRRIAPLSTAWSGRERATGIR